MILVHDGRVPRSNHILIVILLPQHLTSEQLLLEAGHARHLPLRGGLVLLAGPLHTSHEAAESRILNLSIKLRRILKLLHGLVGRDGGLLHGAICSPS